MEAVTALGVPRAPEPFVRSPRDEAVFLLQVGAEIEHALLAQYLYAAWSLNASQDEPRRWQEEILEIAREEMGHLITVQNLLLLLDADVYLERENYPLHTDLYPFPLSLEPLHPQSLAKYVIAESPVRAELPPELRPIAERAGNVNHVGVVYAFIYWIFQATDAPQGPFHLPAGLPFPAGHHLADSDFAVADFDQRQTSKQEWGGGPDLHVDKAGTRAAALEALNTIAVQGEGLLDEDGSHFRRFLKIYQELADLEKAGRHDYVLDVPTNPTTRSAPRDGGTGPDGRITHPGTLRWAELFNRRYEMLLLDIALALSFRSADLIDGVRIRRMLAREWAVQKEMKLALSQIAGTLATLPKDDPPGAPGTSRHAGAPFELPDPHLPVDAAGCWKRELELIEECRHIIAEIGLEHDDDSGTLASVREFDKGREEFVQRRIAAGEHP